jgi:hypothetical protein
MKSVLFQAVLSKVRETMYEEDISFVKENLRSPCTQEIAVFRAFADIAYQCTQVDSVGNKEQSI